MADEQRDRSADRGERAGRAQRGRRAGSLPLAFDAVTEGYLDGLARLARRDPAARNALYRWFEPFCERVAGRLAARPWVRLAEPDDVRHEGFLVFCGLVAGWREDGSFAGYVFAHFAPRLAAALRRFEGVRPPQRAGRADRCDAPRSAVTSAELTAGELLAGLDPLERTLVELLAAGYRPGEVAARLGVTPRTVRRWLERLRATLVEAEPVGG